MSETKRDRGINITFLAKVKNSDSRRAQILLQVMIGYVQISN